MLNPDLPPVYIPPNVVDMVTMAQGIYEQKICGAALIDRDEVLEILGTWKPEISLAACKFWPIFLDNPDSEKCLRKAWEVGLGLDTIVFMKYTAGRQGDELARDSLHRWKCCKAARFGLQAIATDPEIGAILEKSRYKYAR